MNHTVMIEGAWRTATCPSSSATRTGCRNRTPFTEGRAVVVLIRRSKCGRTILQREHQLQPVLT